MHRKLGLVGVALLAIAAGCGRDNNKVDDPLKNDLSLAAQQTPGQLDSISAAERGYTNAPGNAVTRSSSTAPRRTTTTRRSTSSSGTSSSSSGTSATTSSGRTVTEKHAGRDAAIGAAAGAVIGATTSRNKVKGAVIGGAAGGILGAIIGNNVDVKKKKQP